MLRPEANSTDYVAVPHAEVQVNEFYKHIAHDLLELKRMKQLMVWCGSRALPEKPSGQVKDASAIMAGKIRSADVTWTFTNERQRESYKKSC